MDNFHLIDHALIQHKLTYLRDIKTSKKKFRELVEELSMLMAYEVTKDLPLEDKEIETPLEKMTGKVIRGKKLTVVPILRAGLGMVDGIINLIPSARVGHIGLYRDHDTFKPVEYYFKVPQNPEDRDFIIVDPMLATGGSAVAATTYLKKIGAKSIKFICLVAAPEGVKAMRKAHPDVPIYAAALDRELNEHAYILPGLGDAGDRLFGTK